MSAQFHIRPMLASDLDAVLALQAQIYPPQYHEPAAVFASKLTLAARFCLVVENQRCIKGYLFAHPWLKHAPPALFSCIAQIPDRADSLFIHDMALHPDCRGQRMGQQLLQRCLDAARDAGLRCSTLVAVQDAAGFWQHQGYHPYPTQATSDFPGRYGSDALFMRRHIRMI